MGSSIRNTELAAIAPTQRHPCAAARASFRSRSSRVDHECFGHVCVGASAADASFPAKGPQATEALLSEAAVRRQLRHAEGRCAQAESRFAATLR